MKKIIIITAAVLFSIHLYADDIFMTDNSVTKGTINEITADTITYRDADDKTISIAKDKVEKIIYTGGKEITFYDIIQLSDGTNLSGKIIRKTAQYIEYNPAGSIPYDRIELGKVTSIIYENGNREDFTPAANPRKDYDEVHLKNGTILKVTNLRINSANIEFTDESGNRQFYGRRVIDKIIYRDTTELSMNDSAGVTENTGNKTPAAESSATVAFAEFEMGWNGYAGLGARLDYRFAGNFSLNGGLGFGFWGWRASGALRYHADYPYGLAFSIGAAQNSGARTTSEVEVIDSTGQPVKTEVEFELKPVTTLNASILYSWQVFGQGKIYIETGYSYAIQKEKYTYKTDSGYRITDESADVMDFMAPGGVILTIGYAFNL